MTEPEIARAAIIVFEHLQNHKPVSLGELKLFMKNKKIKWSLAIRILENMDTYVFLKRHKS